MIEDILTSLGLTPEQVDIYQSLLTNGAQTASKLAKTTKVQRTYIYRIAQELVAKELVTVDRKDKTSVFVPQSPDHLLTQAEEMKEKAVAAQVALEGILPGLKTKYHAIESKPVVKHFEGEEGVMKANLEVLAEKKEILAYLVINKTIDKKMEDFWEKYYKQRIADTIHVRAITPDTKEGIEYKKRDAEELRETKLVPKDKFPLAIEKNIVGNKVAFFSTREGQLIATIIENKEIADTERAIFELAWKQADHFDKKLSE
jgi:sugar-specific transcriptional regulator TrmB